MIYAYMQGALSFRIQYSWGMFPHWLQHETTNLYYAFKVPHLGVGNKHFIRCIFYVDHHTHEKTYPPTMVEIKFHNKTKDCYSSFWTISSLVDEITFYYNSFHVCELDLEEGDEIEISWRHDKIVVFKKWGVHISYYTMDDTRLKID